MKIATMFCHLIGKTVFTCFMFQFCYGAADIVDETKEDSIVVNAQQQKDILLSPDFSFPQGSVNMRFVENLDLLWGSSKQDLTPFIRTDDRDRSRDIPSGIHKQLAKIGSTLKILN